MKLLSTLGLLGLLIGLPLTSDAQVVSSMSSIHQLTERAITATAELVHEELYDFQPTEEVRTLGQILAHIANGNYQICSTAAGQENPNGENFEETKTSKADIIQALTDAFAYCQGIYASMSDEQGAELIPFLGGQELARVAVLGFNSTHNYEHYGNLVTYMRINGITPPTSSGM